jgi:DNA-binding transcriptional regulator YiaG
MSTLELKQALLERRASGLEQAAGATLLLGIELLRDHQAGELDVAEFAKRAEVSRTTVYAWIEAGRQELERRAVAAVAGELEDGLT